MGEVLSIERRMTQAQDKWPMLMLKRKNDNEASADACPHCSMVDDDGFLVFADGGSWCRKCGTFEWLDEGQEPPSREKLRELRLQAQERKMEELERRLERLEEMHNCEDHLRYHDNLNTHTRQLWYESGIYDEAIDKFQLGYTSQCPTWRSSPSLTIPVYSYENQLVNIRHRLLKPNGAGKYRPHRKGLGSQLFHASLLRESHERLLVLEGEKKVICLDQAGFPAVGIMGKSVWKRAWFEWFDVGRIYIALDPDADESAERLARVFADNGFDDIYIADFPAKPDDLLVKYGAGERHIERILELARPVR